MLNDLWLIISGILVIIGLMASQGLLLVIGALVIIVWLLTRVWDRYAFQRVTLSRGLSRHHAFIGDSLEYTVTLSNDKLLPLIWVDIEDTFPVGLELAGANLRPYSSEGTQQHNITASLLPYQRVTWKYTLRCQARGYHRIGPARLRSGDIFGFGSAETRFPESEYLLVYPRIVDLQKLVLPAAHPLGGVRGQQPLRRDTTRYLGQRDYYPTDPMKHIDWKATARVLRLQTKLFEPVVSHNILVALNASTSEHPWEPSNRRLFERAVTVAASVANDAAGRGWSFGLVSNAVATYSGKWISVPLGASAFQLPLVLEALAMAGPYVVAPLLEVLRSQRSALPPGATLVLVSSVVTEALAQEIAEMKARGYLVLVLYTGNGLPQLRLPRVPVYPVGQSVDLQEEHEPVLAD
jgi:uncharacterized protein (DUF58 family)